MNLADRIRPVLGETLVGVTGATALGYAVERNAGAAVVVGAAAIALWVLTQPALSAFALGASLPLVGDLTGGRLGLHVAASDVVLALLMLQLLLEAGGARAAAAVRSLRPIAYALLPYAAMLVVLVGAHPGAVTFLNTLQRFELFALPLVIGAACAMRGAQLRVLQAYVVAASAVAVIWPFVGIFGLQKNPAGQMIGNAVLLVVGVRELRRFAILAPVLIAGLFVTQSRGAILATTLGLAVLVMSSRDRKPLLAFARLLPIAVAAGLIFQFLPAATRDRITSLTPSAQTSAGYSLHVRAQYKAAAERVIEAHPWDGVGVGRYLSGAGTQASATDPHDVVLLDTAEGGYGLGAAFVVLVVGTLAALRRLRSGPLTAVAAAVFAATVAHGLVDVYWVRGTPVLGWLLVGMTCGFAAAQREVRA